VDLVKEKRLELLNGTHVFGLNSLLSIRHVCPYIRHLPHSVTTRYPRVPVCAVYTFSERCKQVASQVGFCFASLRKEPTRGRGKRDRTGAKLNRDSLARKSSLGKNRVTVYSYPTVTALA
jgi:hypothetical protein